MRRVLVCILSLACAVAHARVLRVDVTRREEVLGGRPFGIAGAYEKIVGRVVFALRPDDPHNRAVTDLTLADRNPQGEVEFSADVYILAPKDPARGNGALLLEIPNRGGKGIVRIVNGGA